MRKIIKDKDGNETVFEGTPEELAELERRLGEGSPRKPGDGKRKLLKENEVHAKKSIRELIEDLDKKVNDRLPPWWFTMPHGLCTCPTCCPNKPYWAEPIKIEPYTPYVPGQSPIWYTAKTSDGTGEFQISGDACGSSELKLS